MNEIEALVKVEWEWEIAEHVVVIRDGNIEILQRNDVYLMVSRWAGSAEGLRDALRTCLRNLIVPEREAREAAEESACTWHEQFDEAARLSHRFRSERDTARETCRCAEKDALLRSLNNRLSGSDPISEIQRMIRIELARSQRDDTRAESANCSACTNFECGDRGTDTESPCPAFADGAMEARVAELEALLARVMIWATPESTLVSDIRNALESST